MSDAIIAVQRLSKSVTDSGGTLDILRDVEFELQRGETVAIVGASGSGKSTLLAILAGLDTPSRGRVLLAGQDLFALAEDDRAEWRARQLGFVFQSFQLLTNLSALENVMLPLELAGRRDARAAATRMLQRVGLGNRMDHRPTQLSGGQMQRVFLCRALMNQPELLVLDEPSTYVDNNFEGELYQKLKELNEKLKIEKDVNLLSPIESQLRGQISQLTAQLAAASRNNAISPCFTAISAIFSSNITNVCSPS